MPSLKLRLALGAPKCAVISRLLFRSNNQKSPAPQG